MNESSAPVRITARSEARYEIWFRMSFSLSPTCVSFSWKGDAQMFWDMLAEAQKLDTCNLLSSRP